MIYRKFLRPRELLEMFIERFEELKEFAGDEDEEEARNTRLRYEKKEKGLCGEPFFVLILPLVGVLSIMSLCILFMSYSLSCLSTPGHLSFCSFPKSIVPRRQSHIFFIRLSTSRIWCS